MKIKLQKMYSWGFWRQLCFSKFKSILQYLLALPTYFLTVYRDCKPKCIITVRNFSVSLEIYVVRWWVRQDKRFYVLDKLQLPVHHVSRLRALLIFIWTVPDYGVRRFHIQPTTLLAHNPVDGIRIYLPSQKTIYITTSFVIPEGWVEYFRTQIEPMTSLDAIWGRLIVSIGQKIRDSKKIFLSENHKRVPFSIHVITLWNRSC